MTHEVGAIAHEVSDVVGITQEVLALDGRTSPITTPVKHQQTKALIGERSLRQPLLGSCSQRAVHQHHGRARAPRVYEEVAHVGSSSRYTFRPAYTSI
jgi:hypothetical protein